MNRNLNRRLFLKRAAITAGALSATRLLSGPNLLHAAQAGNKLNCVLIGCRGRGMSHLGAAAGEYITAIVDPDVKKHAAVRKWLTDQKQDAEKVQAFTDYLKMFD